MNTSFYTGVSGMKTQQFGIDQLSDNIANVNTAGYKATYTEFETIFSKQLTGSLFDPTGNDIGHGATIGATSTDFSIGSFIDSENKYDMVIEGKGWFGMINAQGDTVYTRNGQFSRDANGHLVGADGSFVTGTSANNIIGTSIKNNPSDTISLTDVNAQGPIHIPDSLTIPAIATTFINIKGALDPTRKVESGPNDTQIEIENVEVYRSNVIDKEGNINKLNITFTKKVPQDIGSTTWFAKAIINDENGNVLSTKEGQLNFNGKGALLGNTLTTIDNNGTPISLSFGTFFNPNLANSGYDGLVSLSGLDSSRKIEKDGNAKGILQDYSVDGQGNIQASFSNGKIIPIAKLAVYHFRNEGGLERIGAASFKTSANSGEAKFFKDQAGNILDVSGIKSRKIEISNVDISTALTDLIVMQKAFDASSKSITTSDQMIQNAINMKR